MMKLTPAVLKASAVAAAVLAACVLTNSGAVADEAQLPMIVRGTKSVQILPDAAGPMTIVITKRDMRIYPDPTDLTAVLYDPWHREVSRAVIPASDRAEPAEPQNAEIRLEVVEPGLHRLDVVISGRADALWGLQLSAGRYVVLGEVFVNNPSVSGSIYFAPPAEQFTLSAMTPHDAGIQQIGLYDASGARVGVIALTRSGQTEELVTGADVGDRSGPWHLTLAAMNARITSPTLQYWAAESEMLFDPAGVQRYITPSAKREATYYTPDRVALARQNVERYDWAQANLDLIMRGQPYSYLVGRDYVSAADYAAQSDDFIWELQPPTTIPRIHTHEAIAECPLCGLEVRKIQAWHPWRLDPINHPYKIQCRLCEDWFPSNDFGAGDMTSGPFPDDGDGWLAPDGRRFYLIREYAHACYTAVTIPALRSLSQAWLLTGEPEYARKAAILLARLASVYPNHDDRQDWLWGAPYGGFHPHYKWKSGGMITDLIWETFCTEGAVYAYDAIYEYLEQDPNLMEFLQSKGMPVESAGDLRDYINHYLLRPAAVGLQNGAIRGNLGHHQALAMALALVRDDYSDIRPNSNDMVDWAYHGEGRTAYMMTNALYRDGGGHESPGYNVIKLDFIRVSEAMEQIRARHPESYPLERYPDILGDDKAASMFDHFIDLPLLGSFSPSIGDGGSAVGAIRRSEPRLWSMVYAQNLFAFGKYGNPRYARAATRMDGTIAPGNLFEPYPMDEIQQALKSLDSEIVRKPRLLDGYGTAILESDMGEHRRALMLNYSAIIGHRQADNLHVELYARGLNMLPDLGYPFTWDYRWEWDAHTMAHNTVSVNETIADWRMYSGNAASLFASEDGVHVVSARHLPYPQGYEVAGQPGPEVDQYERTSVLVDVDRERFYVVDLFAVAGGDQHDQSWHGPLVEPLAPDLDWQAQPTGTLAGPEVEQFAEYTDRWGRTWTNFPCYVRDVRRATLDQPRSWEWDLGLPEGDRLRLHIVPVGGPLETIMCAGRSPARPADWKLDYLLCRRMVEEGDRSLYLTVMDAFQGEPVIEQVRLISEDPLELEVTYEGGVDRISLATPPGPSTINEHRPHGLRLVSTHDGQVARQVQVGTWAPGEGPGYVTDTIRHVDYQSRRIAIGYEPGREVEFAPGRAVRIHNWGRSGMYTITDVRQDGDLLWLTLDTTALLARGPVTGAEDGVVLLGANCMFATGRMDGERNLISAGPHFFAGARIGEGDIARQVRAVANTSASSARIFLQEPVAAATLQADYGDGIISTWDYGIGDSVELAVVR